MNKTKFEEALDVTLSINRKRRKSLIIITIVLYVLLGSSLGIFIISNPDIGEQIYTLAYPLAIVAIVIVLFLVFNKRTYLVINDRTVKKSLRIANCLEGKAGGKRLKSEFEKRYKNKDKEWILTTVNSYYTRLEDLKQEHESATKETSKEPGNFDGWLVQEIGWFLLGFLVTLFTFGIAFPVAYCWFLNWEYKHTIYDGKRLAFDGKATQLIGKWLIWILLCMMTLGIFILFIPKKLMAWKVSHLHMEGEISCLECKFRANAIIFDLVLLSCLLLNIVTLTLLRPIFITWRNRYVQNRIVIDGRALYFDGNGIQLIGKYIVWTLLSLITCGIYSLFIHIRLKKWVALHTRIKAGYAH